MEGVEPSGSQAAGRQFPSCEAEKAAEAKPAKIGSIRTLAMVIVDCTWPRQVQVNLDKSPYLHKAWRIRLDIPRTVCLVLTVYTPINFMSPCP